MRRVAAPSLAYGLMQGLTGYMQGQDRRRSMDMEDEAVQRDEARRQQEMAMRQEQMAAQARQMEEARKERERQAEREMQMDRRTAYDRGEQPVEQVRETGGAMMGAGGSGNTFADVGVKAMGGMLTQQAKAPTYNIGETGYVKAMPSVAERAAKMQAEQRASEQNAERIARAGERADDRNFTMQENAKNRAATMAQISARMNPPKETPQPKPLTGSAANRAESMQTVEQALKDYRILLNEVGTSYTPASISKDEGVRRLAAQYGAVQMALKEAFNLGVLNGPDLALIERQLTPPNSIRGGWAGKKALTAEVDQTLGQMQKRGAIVQSVRQGVTAETESPAVARFREMARGEGYSDEEIEVEIRRRGLR